MECTMCKKEKDDSEFPSNGVGGIRHQCKECMREVNKKWRATNKEKVSSYNKSRKLS